MKVAKVTTAEERKSAVAARKADIMLKRQEQLITYVMVKATKATAKADKLRLKLAAAAKAGAPPPAATSDYHTKIKGSSGASATTLVESTPPQQSPQRKVMIANKQVSILQSPLRFPLHNSGESMSGSNASSSSSEGGCPLVGENSNDSSQTTSGSSNTK